MLRENQLENIKEVGSYTLFEEFKELIRDGNFGSNSTKEYKIVSEEVLRRMINGFRAENGLSTFDDLDSYRRSE